MKFLTNEQQKSMKMHKSVISVKKNLKDKKNTVKLEIIFIKQWNVDVLRITYVI